MDKQPQFDIGSAFSFIKEKEGRALPREYVIHLIKTDPAKLSIPEDLGNDKVLNFIYKVIHSPDLLTQEEKNISPKPEYFFKLDLSGSPIQTLPEGLKLNNLHLDLSNCKNLTHIPLIESDSFINLYGCYKLRELPTNLSIRSILILGCTSLVDLPKGFRVHTLSISGNSPILSKIKGHYDYYGDNERMLSSKIKKYAKEVLGGKIHDVLIYKSYG